MFGFNCPKCQRTAIAEADQNGKVVNCFGCHQPLRVVIEAPNSNVSLLASGESLAAAKAAARTGRGPSPLAIVSSGLVGLGVAALLVLVWFFLGRGPAASPGDGGIAQKANKNQDAPRKERPPRERPVQPVKPVDKPRDKRGDKPEDRKPEDRKPEDKKEPVPDPLLEAERKKLEEERKKLETLLLKQEEEQRKEEQRKEEQRKEEQRRRLAGVWQTTLVKISSNQMREIEFRRSGEMTSLDFLQGKRGKAGLRAGGTYQYEGEVLTVSFPGLNLRERLVIEWLDDDKFRMTFGENPGDSLIYSRVR